MKDRYRKLRLWKKLWASNPGLMKEAQTKAQKAAKQAYEKRNEMLKALVSEFPPNLTNQQLKERCILHCETISCNPRSMKNKLCRLGLIKFDRINKLWAVKVEA